MTSKSLAAAREFLSFVNASPTPYHAVKAVKELLIAAGFVEISERGSWASRVERGKKYFTTRNGSSIIAFAVGNKWTPGGSVAIVGAHTDSPVLRVKPVSKSVAHGYRQVGVETYGGGIWHSWFDRDLSVAGRVYICDESGSYVPKLVKVPEPLLRIPTLAIHLDRDVNQKFEFNRETQLYPISGQAEKNSAKSEESHNCATAEKQEFQAMLGVAERHDEGVLGTVARELGVKPENIEDFELVLYDVQPSTLFGPDEEFISSPRLDNLTSCFCAVHGLIASATEESLAQDTGIRLIALFDHEEIGSQSAQGADSTFLLSALKRLSCLSGDPANPAPADGIVTALEETAAKSFLLSADMAHGIHPNYAGKYEKNHGPALNGGPVIKINANQRYATNSPGLVLLKKVAEGAEVPLQLFVVRNDSPCGSTIGPILAAKLGIRTLDLGNPQLSMHSIRETGGSQDIKHLTDLFTEYFAKYAMLEKQILVDAVDV